MSGSSWAYGAFMAGLAWTGAAVTTWWIEPLHVAIGGLFLLAVSALMFRYLDTASDRAGEGDA